VLLGDVLLNGNGADRHSRVPKFKVPSQRHSDRLAMIPDPKQRLVHPDPRRGREVIEVAHHRTDGENVKHERGDHDEDSVGER
jgi:hypothetical protein